MDYEIIAPSRGLLAPAFFEKPVPPGANPGLVFDRFLAIWSGGKRAKELHEPLARFALRCNEAGSEHQNLLATYHARQIRTIERANRAGQAGVTLNCTVAWRLTSGLGNDHPLENGFTLDYLTGAPYLRASGLKGLCRRAAAMAGEVEGWDGETLFDLFGSRDPVADEVMDNKARGDIVFLDAYPTCWPKLEVEVMNCHHQRYYSKNDVLRETEDPVPVFFLTVGAGAEFAFRFFSRTGSESKARRIKEALVEGLTLLGVGAKTAVGYGRFVPPVAEGERWLERVVKELKADHNEPDEKKILRGKPLAGRWQTLPDDALKQEVRSAIERRWREAGLFEASGKSLKQVKQIYGWE